MPPKKDSAATKAKKPAAAPAHGSYKDMAKEAILNLKERNGSSRSAISKYILANNQGINSSGPAFSTQLNKAIRTGVAKGEFIQPKGPSGTVKLAAPKGKSAEPKPAAAKPAAAKKVKPTTTPKKVGAPKKTATKAKAAPKKVGAPKKTAAKPKANSASKRKTPAAAPAIVEPEKTLTKTKSGRVAKTTAKPAKPAKKAAPKKATPKKSATPKKKADAPAA